MTKKNKTTNLLDGIPNLRIDDVSTINVAKKRTSARQTPLETSDDTTTITKHRISLFIRGLTESIDIKDGESIYIGRSDTNATESHFIDLTPYGALERGVSRKHLQLTVKDNKLYAVDLQSANHTYLDGVQLEAKTEYVLRAGANIVLGRMPITILFE